MAGCPPDWHVDARQQLSPLIAQEQLHSSLLYSSSHVLRRLRLRETCLLLVTILSDYGNTAASLSNISLYASPADLVLPPHLPAPTLPEPRRLRLARRGV